ncbi:hypothetical protein [Jeotgalibacillus sp. R-1-5s-1]|uniref:hypothetical protein n=1 Tax=Jeotgalibacillus sp. R-1-5s-1 TaxID=2555897 RepID=UPI00106CC67D|nr:hypothetical protein [Jeotgalibacillus sp. R-1-5s-1]TFD92420.1 hypothetical protein E2491_16700 [Jeotgalibacillus sp. R-1-5s-1]
MELSKKDTIVIMLIFLLFLQLIVFWLFFVRPLNEEADKLSEQVEGLEDQVALKGLESQPADQNQNNTPVSIDNRFPVTPSEEQLLLGMQQAELMSNTRLETVDFVMEDPELTGLESEEDSADLIDGVVPDDDVTDSQEEDKLFNQMNGYEQLTFESVVSAGDYTSLLIFIEEMERLERFIRFNELYFTQSTLEDMLVNDLDEPIISLEMEVSTYYYGNEPGR